MAIFSSDKILSEFIEKAYASLLENKFTITPESFKEIDYGISFKVKVFNSNKDISIAVYRTEKKGFSFVTKDQNIRSLLNRLLTSTGIAGNDEAGKGDFFGPLVVCSFVLGNKETELLKMNIKDSKKLKQDEILKIYERVKSDFPSSFSTVRIMPERYNSFYNDLSEKGKNLNNMLAWAHSKALSGLVTKRDDIKKVIVDRFSENPAINGIIISGAGTVPVEFFVRAEQNPAVAVASILARAQYLISLRQLSETVLGNSFELISGSGAQADVLLSEITKKFGKEILNKLCKTHFANYTKTL